MRARYDSTRPRDVTRPAVMRRLQIEDRLLVDLEELHDRRGLRLWPAACVGRAARASATSHDQPRKPSELLVSACAEL